MRRSNNRLRLVYFIMLTVSMLVIVNVFLVTIGHVHIRSNTSLEDYVTSVSTVNETIFASRGNIYDSNGVIVAQDVNTYDIICYLDSNRLKAGGDPAYVVDPAYTARMLSPILGMEEIEIYTYLTENKNLYQTELGQKGRNLSEEVKEEILAIDNLYGIDFRNSYTRNYPLGSEFAPYLIGFAQSDDSGKLIGKMGLEEYLNEELSGVDGSHEYQQDKNGYVLPGMYEETIDAIDGYDVYLTLDSNIQNALETCMLRLQSEKEAKRAWGAVVEVKTGKILAWSQTPSFDPNVLEFSDYNNYGSQLSYEPGSTMKAIIYAAAMDMGVYDGNTTFDSSPFCVTGTTSNPYRTYTSDYYECIHNVDNRQWGYIPLDYGLIYSSNVATSTLLTQYVGINNYKKYLEAFHLYCDLEVNSDGIDEVVGYSNYGYSPADDLTAAYGQGSTVTMLQLLQAYTAIFGNGEMIKPYYIDKIVDPNNEKVVYQAQRDVVSTPISSDTAKQMQELLRRVVTDEQGTARHYKVEGVDIIAKTGTADIASNGDYEKDNAINSVMLAFPYEDPQYEVYVAYESSTTIYYNYDKKPINDLVSSIARLTDVGYTLENDEIVTEIKTSPMPNLLGEDINEAISSLDELDLDIITIGNGDSVIDQMPRKDNNVYTKQKVFLLTNDDNVTLPDFTNWTRKEIVNYWSLSGLSITIEGYGVAYEQNIEPYSSVNKSDNITVKLRDINYVESVEEIDDFESE